MNKRIYRADIQSDGAQLFQFILMENSEFFRFMELGGPFPHFPDLAQQKQISNLIF